MAFLLPRDPLTPMQTLQVRVAPGTRVLRRADVAALVDASALVDAARLQAREIIAGAEAVLEAERQRGFAKGVAQARAAQAEQMIETVGRTVEYLANVETEMVTLVMDAIRKIIDNYHDSERVHILVKNALSVVRKQKQVTLRLHPEQVDGIRALVSELLLLYPGITYLDIAADARLKMDACILESEIGTVETSIEDQIGALRSAFEKVLGNRT